MSFSMIMRKTLRHQYPISRNKSKLTPPINREPALENYITSVEWEIHLQVNRAAPTPFYGQYYQLGKEGAILPTGEIRYCH